MVDSGGFQRFVMMQLMKKTRLAVVFAVLAVLGFASHAVAYIGPGAGGGAPSGIGVGGWIVMIVAGGLGLCLLCGLIAVVIAASDRVKSWAASRRRADSSHSAAIERPGS